MSNEFKKNEYGAMEHVDRDGDGVRVQHYGDDLVYIECFDGEDGDRAGAFAPAAALIAAIKEAAGIEDADVESEEPKTWTMTGTLEVDPETIEMLFGSDPDPDPEPLWTEVRERPARAVKVTPELVQILATPGRPAELRELSPWFSPHTGNPAGVGFDDPHRYETTSVPLGKYVILRPGQLPQVMIEDEFERLFEVAK